LNCDDRGCQLSGVVADWVEDRLKGLDVRLSGNHHAQRVPSQSGVLVAVKRELRAVCYTVSFPGLQNTLRFALSQGFDVVTAASRWANLGVEEDAISVVPFALRVLSRKKNHGQLFRLFPDVDV
jgi:hypothetical protein